MITIEFENVAEVERVLQALAKLPYAEVTALIAKIHGQAISQLPKPEQNQEDAKVSE